MVRAAEDFIRYRKAQTFWEGRTGPETPLSKKYVTPEGKYKFTGETARLKKKATSHADTEVSPEARRIRHWHPPSTIEGDFRRQKSKGKKKAKGKKRTTKKHTTKKRKKNI